MEQDIIKKIEYRGYCIAIARDTCPQNPRTEWDNPATIYTRHSRYCPEKEFNDHFEPEEVFENGIAPEFSRKFLQNYIALPVYLYDHSGQTVSTAPFSCKWDSGLFGIIAMETGKVKKEYGWKTITKKRRERIEEYLTGEVKTYDDYLRGDVYGFTITDENQDEIESCWGYFGDECLEQMEKECKSAINSYIIHEETKALKKNQET